MRPCLRAGGPGEIARGGAGIDVDQALFLCDLAHRKCHRRGAEPGDHLDVLGVVPATRDRRADIGLGLMIGRQDLDRSTEHLAADIFDGELHGLDFAGREVAIDT